MTAWALIGLLAMGRTDVAGAVGATVLVLFLIKGRMPTVYAGVFFAVAFLEIYGTAVGIWTWQELQVPGIGVPDGNPPSGAASGYVFFDIAALALAPGLLRAGTGSPDPSPRGGPEAVGIRGGCLYSRGQGRRELGRSQGVRQRVLVPRSGVRILPPQPGRDSTFFPGTDTRTA